MTDAPPKKLSGQETIKRESHYLKGRIAEELSDNSTPQVSDSTYELLKFHGSYFGYDRDSATARKQQGLDKEYEFMVRMKCPGGRLTAAQYIALDVLCEKYANGSLRITTRETFQFHCIKKTGMKPLVGDINRLLLSTIGGCGDIVRNVLTCPAPIKDREHAKLEEDCFALAKFAAPKSKAYYEVWMDGEVVHNYPFLPEPSSTDEVEPLYKDTYMPRKFKIAVAAPDDNCMDVLCNDLSIISLFDDRHREHFGYNFALGGGLGMNHNQPKTYPFLSRPVMYVPPDMLLPATEAVIKLQRDFGDRSDRKHARLKYVVNEKGVPWVKAELEKYLGRGMDDPRPTKKWGVVDHTGWNAQGDGKWFLGVPIPSGRIADFEGQTIRSGLREVIIEYGMDLRLTADQNILLCDIEEGEKRAIEAKLRKHGIRLKEDMTKMAKNFIACVAYPTCGKALAEAERAAPDMIKEIEKVMQRQGVIDENIAIRVAGCPNGCPRPYVGDIGIVGRTPDTYALYIGGDFEGTRLNEKVFDKVPYASLSMALEPMFALWNEKRNKGEGFGDFCHRHGVADVKQAAVAAIGADWAKYMYPIALNLAHVPLLLIGRGELVERRLAQLKEAGAERVILKKSLGKGDIEKASIVLVAGLPREEAEVIVSACRIAAKLVNVEDINDLCDFYFTANVKRGDLVIAVSTSGASPTLARKVRDAIGVRFGNEWANRTRELAALRMKWRAQGMGMKEVVAESEAYIAKKGWFS